LAPGGSDHDSLLDCSGFFAFCFSSVYFRVFPWLKNAFSQILRAQVLQKRLQDLTALHLAPGVQDGGKPAEVAV